MVSPYIFAVCFAFLEIFLGRVPLTHKTQTEKTDREHTARGKSRLDISGGGIKMKSE